MYLGSSGHQNLKKKLPEDCSPPGPSKASKVIICIQGSSGHQNLKKELPEDCAPPVTPKDSKVVICIRENVPREVKQPKPDKNIYTTLRYGGHRLIHISRILFQQCLHNYCCTPITSWHSYEEKHARSVKRQEATQNVS